MKLRCEMEVEVPDEVGEAVLAKQKDNYVFREFIHLGKWSYDLAAPLVWKRVEDE